MYKIDKLNDISFVYVFLCFPNLRHVNINPYGLNRKMAALKDCYDLTKEAEEIMEKIKDICPGSCDDYMWWLSGVRKYVKSTVAEIKAGKPLSARFSDNWDDVVSDALDHMLEDRLAGHAWKIVSGKHLPDFNRWSDSDVTLYKLFDELTEVVKELVKTCKPENEANAAIRAAKNAVIRAAKNAAIRAAKNAAAEERQAKKNATRNAKKAAANAKKAAMTNETRAAAANRAAKAAATRNAKKAAEKEAGEALLAAQPGRPKRGAKKTRKNRRSD
jgi:regulator of protease activity HflC (stomatin/prohibitin superfamily)